MLPRSTPRPLHLAAAATTLALLLAGCSDSDDGSADGSKPSDGGATAAASSAPTTASKEYCAELRAFVRSANRQFTPAQRDDANALLADLTERAATLADEAPDSLAHYWTDAQGYLEDTTADLGDDAGVVDVITAIAATVPAPENAADLHENAEVACDLRLQ